MANKGRANLIPGGYKLTDEDRAKARESRRVNASMRKTAKEVRGTAWSSAEADAIFDAFGIPEQKRTVGTLIVLRAALGAMEGNQGDRRDYIRLTGDDPDVAAEETELKLKQAQAEQKSGGDTERQEAAIRARASLMAQVEAEERRANDQ